MEPKSKFRVLHTPPPFDLFNLEIDHVWPVKPDLFVLTREWATELRDKLDEALRKDPPRQEKEKVEPECDHQGHIRLLWNAYRLPGESYSWKCTKCGHQDSR